MRKVPVKMLARFCLKNLSFLILSTWPASFCRCSTETSGCSSNMRNVWSFKHLLWCRSNTDLQRNIKHRFTQKLWEKFHEEEKTEIMEVFSWKSLYEGFFNLKGKYLQHNLTSWSFWSSSLSSLDHQNYSDHDHLQTCCQPLFWKCLFLITLISIIIIIIEIITINYW